MSGNYHELSDTELVRKVKEEDCDAFTELSGRYFWLIRAKAAEFEGASSPEKEEMCIRDRSWGSPAALLQTIYPWGPFGRVATSRQPRFRQSRRAMICCAVQIMASSFLR